MNPSQLQKQHLAKSKNHRSSFPSYYVGLKCTPKPANKYFVAKINPLTTRILCPMALAGRLERNLARTMPLFPWARVTFPQITRVLLGLPPGVTVLLRKERKIAAEHTSHSSVRDQQCSLFTALPLLYSTPIFNWTTFHFYLPAKITRPGIFTIPPKQGSISACNLSEALPKHY